MSPPAGRMCAPGRVAVATSPPSTSSASSIGTTASAPGGSGAPVAMPDAEPAGSACGASPAATRNAIGSGPLPSSAARTA